jgi:hypothetical protein
LVASVQKVFVHWQGNAGRRSALTVIDLLNERGSDLHVSNDPRIAHYAVESS